MYPKVKLWDISKITYWKNLPTKLLKQAWYTVFWANWVIGYFDDYLYEDEMLLISCRWAYSWKINMSPKKSFITNNSLIVDLNCKDSVHKKLVYYFLQAVNKTNIITWTAQPQVTINNVLPLEIPLPSLPTQHLIVSEIEKQFSRLDEWLLSLRRAKENLKKYKASVLKSAVEWKLTEDFRKTQKLESASILLEKILEERKKKFLSENPGKKYKESEGIKLDDLPNIELPEWWEFVKLDNLWELWRWKSKHRPRNDQKLFWWNYPFIQTWEVTNSNWKITEFTKTYSDFWLSQSKLWPKWTLCITIAANIAYTWFLTFDACFPDSVVWIKVDENYININFIDIYFKNIRQELERYAPATAQKNINLEILNKLPVPLPPLSEQNEIVKIVESKLSVVEKLEKLVDENIKRSENLKQSILKKAFEWELVREE